MTTQELIDLYNILIDKYGSAYQTDDEIIDLLNMAHYEYLNRLVPDSQGGIVNFEFDSNTLQNLKPLVWTLSVSTNGSGSVTTAALDTAVQTASSDATAEVFRIMSIGYDDKPVRFLKQNDAWSFTKNFFKAPSTSNPRYTVEGSGYQLWPKTSFADVEFAVIKTPKKLALTPSPVNPELSDYVLTNILMIALQFGGISIRDQELIMDIRNNTIQNAK